MDQRSQVIIAFLVGACVTLGAALLLTSPAFWVPPFVLLARRGAPSPGATYGDTTRVVSTGVYGVVRHPQYLGYCLLVVGFVLTGFNGVSVGCGMAALVGFALQAREEERHLALLQSADWDEYRARVPAFDPVRGLLRYLRRTR